MWNITRTELPGVLVVEPRVFLDERGFFMETWREDRYREVTKGRRFVQDNLSSSTKGTLRGLHFQHPKGQGKLVQVVSGGVFDVVVDIRSGSRTFGKWFGIVLSGEKHNQMYIPPGFAHGYYVLSDIAVFGYKCTDYYSPETEGGVLWNDPDLGIQWPLTGGPLLSDKDASYPLLSEIHKDRLPSIEDYS